jgi:hypothetical protein
MAIASLLLFLLLSSCAVGPLTHHETARTVGDTHHEISAGLSPAGHALKWNYGATHNIDFGLQIESFSAGGRVKWAIRNRPLHGLSVALAFGSGLSIGGRHSYLDLTTSYSGLKWGEPYLSARATMLLQSTLVTGSYSTGNIQFTASATTYQYVQYFVGNRFWISDRYYLGIEGSTFQFLSGLTSTSKYLLSATLGLRYLGSPPIRRSTKNNAQKSELK